ncbi:peptidylprolyl isomerase [bacterium]|nr:peptidylprolyl isomerase [bacterium]MBU1958485.1 peptidylprolyl isomerase [bacterium]
MIKKTITIALASLMLMTVAHAESKYGTVNGNEITQLDIDMTMGPSGMEFASLNPEMQKRVLDMVVERKLLAQAAQKTDIANSKEYKEQLEELKKGLLLDIWMKKEMKKIEEGLSKSKLEEYYKKNTSKYQTPTKLKASHILLTDEDNATEIIKTLEKAKDVKAEFTKLAKEKSTGPSGPNGGDLGWFELERMVPEFSAAANKLKKGEFTKAAVKTQFGYHVIYLDDRKDAGTRKFEEVESSIKDELSGEAFTAKIKEMTSTLKKSAKIELK